VLNHFEEMIDHYGEMVAIPLARKHIGWYSGGIKSSSEFRAKVNTTQGAQNVRDILKNFYEAQIALSEATIQYDSTN
jgi:tRNA-dihydrouridine synthase B